MDSKRAISGHSHITAITGGIGSGKSVVCAVLHTLGYSIYDCDSRAKAIMDADAELISAIGRNVHPDAVRTDGTLDRAALGQVVFGDARLMKALNALVHDAVKADFAMWCERHATEEHIFVETAILMTSGMDALVDDVWFVTAPTEVRTQRIVARNNLSAGQALQRISAQQEEADALKQYTGHIYKILNTDKTALLPQILSLLGSGQQ